MTPIPTFDAVSAAFFFAHRQIEPWSDAIAIEIGMRCDVLSERIRCPYPVICRAAGRSQVAAFNGLFMAKFGFKFGRLQTLDFVSGRSLHSRIVQTGAIVR
jgi:hypothetical protein